MTTTLRPISDSTTAVTQTNDNFKAVSAAGLYGFNSFTTTGLTFGFYGGRAFGNTVADGTVSLTASTTNYLVANRSTGAVTTSTGTTNWNDTTNYMRLYSVATGTATITSYVDERQAYGDAAAGGGGMSNPMTTAGDIIYGGTPSGGIAPPTRLGVGTNGHVLTLSSGLPVWAASSGGFTGGTLTSALNEAPPATVASASTTNIGAAASNTVIISGTTTINAFDTIAAGAIRRLRFSGILTLTHNGTTLILPAATNIITAAGDVATFESLGSGNWRCVDYFKQDGTALVGGGGGLTNFTETLNTSSPNGTNNAVRLAVTGGSTIADIVLSPKSTGAILAQIPDSTATGGNKRGLRAFDFQMARGTAAQVASGNDSVTLGNNNTANASWSVAIGYNNTSSNSMAMCYGNANTASGANSLAMGSTNTASGSNSTSMGQQSTSSAADAISVGNFCLADAANAVAMGYHCTARTVTGAWAYASGPFSARGDAQRREFILRRATANATPVTMGTDNATGTTTNQITLPTGSALRFTADVVARDGSTGDAASWAVVGLAKNVGGTVTLVGTPTVTKDFNDASAASWVCAVTADNTNKAVAFTVTGVAATNIKWVVRAISVEVVG